MEIHGRLGKIRLAFNHVSNSSLLDIYVNMYIVNDRTKITFKKKLQQGEAARNSWYEN